MYISTDRGTIISVGNNGASAMFDSPYRSKYGETIGNDTKNPGDYSIDTIGGGE